MLPPTLMSNTNGVNTIENDANITTMCHLLLYQNLSNTSIQRNSTAIEEIKDWWNNMCAENNNQTTY